MKLITKKEFDEKTVSLGGKHWATKDNRWEYYKFVLSLLKDIEANKVLEIGSVGVKLIEESDELDYDVKAVWPTFNPKYYHDLRNIPYPIENDEYDLIICLRVLHHLHGKQKDVFDEFKRISNKLILAIPHERYGYDDVIEWSDGLSPTLLYACKKTPTNIYYWEDLKL